MTDSATRLREVSERLKQREFERELVVLVLGIGTMVGAPNEDLEKRLAIRRHLSDHCPKDKIVLPEELIDEETRRRGETRRAERELAAEADLILAIVPPHARVGGVFIEITDFLEVPEGPEKIWVFRPDDRTDLSLDIYSLPERYAYESVDESRLLSYEVLRYIDCNYIRPRAVELVNARRRTLIARDTLL